jgi:hypothetical protein
MATSTINSMGKLNTKWGICGFASALYALHEHSSMQQQKGLSSAAEVETRMLAEIKSYLRMLQADNRADLLNKIQIFTRSFGGQWAAFEIDKYIEKINASVKAANAASLGDFSIAMPPDAVVDYLKRMCDFKLARILTAKESDPKELILGVSKPDMKMYNGLAHWVYQLNGVVYSWGTQFVSLENFLSTHSYGGVAWKIATA